MRQIIRRIIGRYGNDVTLVTGSVRTVIRAFLQPITTRSLQQMRRKFGADGEFVRGHYLILAEQDILSAEYLVMDGRAFCLRCGEPIRHADEVLYWWGLAEPMGEESTWTS